MRYMIFLMGIFLSAHAFAGPPLPVIPKNQYLTSVDYAKEGEQTGCGLRITGETGDNLWINVLVSVFTRESGTLYGMFKVVAKKIIMQDGEPLIQDGKVIYSSIGKIHKAWIKTTSGIQPMTHEGGESPHNDGYMAALKFDNAADLLIALPQENFMVGFSKMEDGSEETFEFNKRITPDEANKLSACMKNLRGTREERSEKSF